MGCVYLIKHRKMEPIKIGYSSSPTPSKRIESMGTYAPFGVELIGWFTHPQAVAIEKKLHKQYAPFRLNGEWFNITKEQAKAIIYSYDNSFPDRAQRALLKQESWDSVDSDNDIRMVKDVFNGLEMPRSEFFKKISNRLCGGDYKGAQKWVKENLRGLPWYHEYKQDTGGRGRKGMLVYIGEVKTWQE